MSQDAILYVICVYAAGFAITVFTIEDLAEMGKKVFLWPIFWLYLVAAFFADLFGGERS